MLSRNLEQTLHRALSLASERRHEYATLEHLLLGLADDTDAATVLRACGVDLDKLRSDLSEFLDKDLAGLATDRSGDPKPTAGFQRVVQRAAIHVQSSGRDEVTGANVLVALFSERESHAVYFLQLQDMTRLDAVNFISHGIAKAPGRAAQRPVQGTGSQPETHQEQEREEKPSRRNQDALSNYCVNLNKKAMAGKIDPLIGRESEIERTIQILCRRTKNNPLYVGDPGVGKTAIAEGLAKRIVEGDVPEVLGAIHHLCAGHGRAAGGHPLSRRLRGAAEGCGRRTGEPAGRDPVHRRDPHGDRRRCHQRRRDGCVEPAEAGAGFGQPALHRLDHLQGVPQLLREGPRAGPPLPEDRRERADPGRQREDPARPEGELREAPQGALHRRGDPRRGGAVGEIHQRPQAARQGDRRDRRGRRLADAAARAQAPQDGDLARRRGDRRQDRPHPSQERVGRRQGDAAQSGARPEGDGVRPGQGDRRRCRRRSSWRAPACASRRSRSATTCSAARPASARPRWRGSLRQPWASN